MPVDETPAGAGKEAAAAKQAAKADTAAAIAEIAGSAEQPDEGQVPAPTPPPGGEAPDAEPTPEPVKVDDQPEQPPTPEKPALREEDVATEYMGIDLSGLPAETRQGIMDEFKGKDRYITDLNQRLAEERKQAGEPEQPAVEEPPVEPPSDDDLLKALGFNPEDPMYEVQKDAVLPLAKALQPHLQTLQVVAQKQFLQDTVEQWNTDIDALASKFGPLPDGVTHDDILDFAVENSIVSPAEAYLTVTGSARTDVQAKAAEARAAAAQALAERKRDATTTRPRPTVATEAKPVKGARVRDVFAQAAQEAADELGVSWAQAVAEERG